MRYLLDTNILVRIAQPGHPLNQEARQCVRTLLRKKQQIFIVPQIIFEFWVVATRPATSNGLGLSIENTRRKIKSAEAFFQIALDTQTFYGEWTRLVETHRVSGVLAHDVHIVAAMRIHGIENLVSFNRDDFARFHSSEINVFTPHEINSSFAV